MYAPNVYWASFVSREWKQNAQKDQRKLEKRFHVYFFEWPHNEKKTDEILHNIQLLLFFL